jgi:hypothetical protein
MPNLATFATSTDFLGSRNERTVPGIRATEVCRVDADTIGIRYHRTIVVYQHRDGTFTLNGWAQRSATTKARMNDFSSANIRQVGGVWYNRGQLLHYGETSIGADGMFLPETLPAME